MNSVVLRNILRFIFFLLLQVLVLKSFTINLPFLSNLNIIMYPIVIFLLPIAMPAAGSVITGFLLGIIIDFFYNTPGVHASTTTFTAFVRQYVLRMIEPRGGYNVDGSPTMYQFGRSWFVKYCAVMLAIHLFVLFSVQAFTLYYILDILIKTILSFVGSFLFILAYMLLINPKE